MKIMINALLFAIALLCPSCGKGSAEVTTLPDPSADDRPPHSAPELPRAYVELPATSPKPSKPLGRNDDLQKAIDDAKPGDVITLQPGVVFHGVIALRAKNGSDWITVQTANATAVAAAGSRVDPSRAPAMAVIESDDNAAMRADEGANHYRFIGIEIRPKSGAFIDSLISLGTDMRSLDALPHHIIFERCYIHADPTLGGRRGIALNTRDAAVIDSYISGFREHGADSQAIAGWNGAGPFAIINNYLEAAGENLMFGGGDPDITNLVPADIEIRANDFVKPLAWRGAGWTVKNLFELKNARRVLIDGNVFENNWADAQNGFAILFTPRNQDGGSPWATVRDVTFTNNIVRHSANGVNVLGTDDIHSSLPTKRIVIRDNIFDDVNGEKFGWRGILFQMLDGPADVVIDHNTAFQTGPILVAAGTPTSDFIYRNNLTPHNEFGVGGDDYYGNPAGALHHYFPDAEFVRNVLIGGPTSRYPDWPNNFFPATITDVKLIDYAAGNYKLANDSPYKNGGTDGKDIGANIASDPTRGRRRAVGH